MRESAGPGRPDSGASPRNAAKAPVARQAIPRGAHARERVLGAALEVLAEQGLPGFTMEAVAHRARASKATLYRRWASTGSLLIEAMDHAFQPFPVPVTGALRTNLIELLTRFEALVSGQPFPQLLAVFIDAAERDPSLASLHVQLTERRREPIRRLLERAQQAGEIPAAADLDLAVDLLASPAFYRRFIAHRAFPTNYASAVVDYVLVAIGFARSGQHDVGSTRGKRRSSPRRPTR